MEDIIFNSRSKSDKYPFGAVMANSQIKLGLWVKNSLNITAISLVLHDDMENKSATYPLNKTSENSFYSRYELSFIAPKSGLYWYHFNAEVSDSSLVISNCGGKASLGEYLQGSWQLTIFDEGYETPSWIKGGLFYQIFVDRFNRASNHPLKEGATLHENLSDVPDFLPNEKGEIKNCDFFGGDLEGVSAKLPYLKELGVTCIYLNPIFQAYSNHKYDTGDYMRVDPAFGDDESFRSLCEKADIMGMKVIIDGVFNHTGSDSLYFNREGNYGTGGAYNDPSSPYSSWYNFTNFPDEYEAWWGFKTLPQVNENDPAYREFILGDNGVIKKWLRLGAMGWRLDVADELPDEFIEELRKSVKSESDDNILLGEVWEDATNKIAYSKRRAYFHGKELDSVMNYPFKDAIIGYMKTENAQNLAETIEALTENYPKTAMDCLMNSLGTHDTARILTVLSGKMFDTREERAYHKLTAKEYESAKNLLKLASAINFTLPGVPCVYYGDEVGLEGFEDPFNRRYYPWGNEDLDLLNWYKKLGKLRQENKVYIDGEYETLSSKNGVFSFVRENADECVKTIVNLGEAPLFVDTAKEKVLISFGEIESNLGFFLPKGSCTVIKAVKS